MHDTKPKSSDLRKQHNADLIRRMRNGEPLNAVDSKASWYPPRPTIKKDARELDRLYGSAETGAQRLKPVRAPRSSDQVINFVAAHDGILDEGPTDRAS